MGFFRQNLIPVSVLSASTIVIVALVVRLASAPHVHVHAHGMNMRPSFPPAPGREMERIVSPAEDCVALLYTSDGMGVVPVGATVMLQSLRPAGTVSVPVVVASASLESVPFQGICGVRWVGRGVLEIESYNSLSVLLPNWHGIHVRVKYRDAAQEMP